MPSAADPRDYRGDFEVHLTVSAPTAPARERFRGWCAGRGHKCVWIVLARGEHTEQPMATWRRGHTNLPVVRAEAEAQAAELTRTGLAVTRVKIEVAPTNSDVPQTDADATEHPSASYFEHHIKLLRRRDQPRDALLAVCGAFGAHLSRNAFRDAPGEREERFVTLRAYALGAISADRTFRALLAALREAGEQVLEAESEYCVHDSAVALDAGWLTPAV